MLSSWLYKSISSSEHWKQNAVAVVGVLCVCVPVIVLCQSESLLMQGSSCYCDSLSHSRSGRTISALPAALSWSLHNMHIHTRQRVREPLPQSCWGDKKWRGVCVWESLSVCVGLDGRGVCVCVQWICPFQFAFHCAHRRLCKETDLLLQLAAEAVAKWGMHLNITVRRRSCALASFLKSSNTF